MQSLWRTVSRFLKKLGIKLPNDPAISLLGIYSEETITEKDTCIPTFIAAILTIVRTWNNLDEWIKKLRYMYTMKYFSTLKETNLSQCHEVDEPRACYTE